MGNCMHRRSPSSVRTRHSAARRQSSTSSVDINNLSQLDSNSAPTGRNKRLKKDKLRWKSELSLTESELEAKRNEFWDTAPVFGGKIEIWNALRAAIGACESDNYSLAQAIIDCAQITLPHGVLSDCYDELGNRYQLPNYLIERPLNLKKKVSENQPAKEKVMKEAAKLSEISESAKAAKKQLQLKFRFSGNFDELKLTLSPSETVEVVKQRIAKIHSIEPVNQRMYFGGKLLKDKQKLKALGLKKNFVIQVILRQSIANDVTPSEPNPSVQEQPEQQDELQKSINSQEANEKVSSI